MPEFALKSQGDITSKREDTVQAIAMRSAGQRIYRMLYAALIASLFAGCVTWVPPFDNGAMTRINGLTSNSLAMHQSLIDTNLANRGDLFASTFSERWSEIEAQARVHLVFEQSRESNIGSIEAATELLGFWTASKQQYCKAVTDLHSSACGSLAARDKSAMSDIVLTHDRTTLEQILGAMIKAEEAKKLASNASR
ncbi:hypothetical protein [Achromobacter kerstersii]|uniref:hypothetical protein n=1 Tax=Achromobacter kerstersii TaxID=1353890 RepID=UPI00320B59EB